MTLSEEQRKTLEKIYFDNNGSPGSYSAERPLYLAAKKVDKTLTRKLIREFLKSVDAYVQHKRILRKFKRRSMLVLFPNNVWCADTIYYTFDASVQNKRAKYCLCVYETFSHYGWAEPLLTKSAEQTLIKFKLILAQAKAQPQYLFVDKGK